VSRGFNTIGTQQLVFFGTVFTQAFFVLIGSVKIILKGHPFKLILSANIKMLNCNHFHCVNHVLQFVSGFTRYLCGFFLKSLICKKTCAVLFMLCPHFIDAWTFFIICT